MNEEVYVSHSSSALVISAEFDVVFINLLGAKKPFIQSQKHICLFVNLTDKASILVIQSLNDPFYALSAELTVPQLRSCIHRYTL